MHQKSCTMLLVDINRGSLKQYMKLTHEEYLDYLEDVCMSFGCKRCSECSRVYDPCQLDDEYAVRGVTVCENCAPYMRRVEREDREYRESVEYTKKL